MNSVKNELNDSGHSEEDLRYITDDDLISSDDTGSDKPVSNKLMKYNQLNPKAGLVYKLLKSAQPKPDSIWKEANIVPKIDNICNSLKSNRILNLNSSNDKMVKSKKRKHDELSSESLTSTPIKKAKKHSDRKSPKKVKRKERTHSMSSSNDEDSSVMSVGCYEPVHSTPVTINGIVKDKSETSQLNHNSFGQSDDRAHSGNVGKGSESDEYQGSNLDSDAKISSQDADHRRFHITPNMKYHLEKNVKKVPKTNETLSDDSLSMVCFKVGEADKEAAISKYSLLLDDDLLANYNFYNLQCPYYINNYNLKNQCLHLEENCNLEDGENEFEAYIIKNSKKILTTLAVPSGEHNFKQFRVPIIGNIIVEQSVNNIAKADFCIAETPQFVEFPENLRTRHPLLGLEYEDQPKTVIFHKKKHSKKQRLSEVVEQHSEEDSYVMKHKKKKHKRPKEND